MNTQVDELNYENNKKVDALYKKYGDHPVIKYLSNLQETRYKNNVEMWNQINHIERRLMEDGILDKPPTSPQQTDSLGVEEAERIWKIAEAAKKYAHEEFPKYRVNDSMTVCLYNGFKAGAQWASTQPTSEALKGEAIGFAEWINKNDWMRYSEKKGWHQLGNNYVKYTTEQLYSLYIKSKQ